jgi:hypothetical protein
VAETDSGSFEMEGFSIPDSKTSGERTEEFASDNNISDIYLEGVGFESRPGHLLS